MAEAPGLHPPVDDIGTGAISFSRPNDVVAAISRWKAAHGGTHRLNFSVTFNPTMAQYVIFYEYERLSPYPIG